MGKAVHAPTLSADAAAVACALHPISQRAATLDGAPLCDHDAQLLRDLAPCMVGEAGASIVSLRVAR